MHVALRFEVRADLAAEKACQQFDIESLGQVSSESDVPKSSRSHLPVSPALQHPQLLLLGLDDLVPACVRDNRAVAAGRLTDPRIEDGASCRDAEPSVVAERKAEFVGRITGMVDCKWNGGSRVSFGQKVDLASGLMEITYDTGGEGHLAGAGHVFGRDQRRVLGGWEIDGEAGKGGERSERGERRRQTTKSHI